MSVAKAVYWFLYYTPGYYLTVSPALARSTLMLNHRYLVDALVDPRRYRYGGPRWLSHLVWKLAVKPDLVILLDAPAEVIQARKQEVPLEETARQREAYRSLVGTMPNGRIADATQPIDKEVAEVNEFILRFLAARVARRFGLRPEP
jgi:thymidylate kinase